MVVSCKLIASTVITVSMFPVVFLVCAVFQYGRTVIPPGIEQPLKMRLYQTILISVLLWGDILEKLGLYSRTDFLRFAMQGLPTFRDSSLLIQNKKFDEVPVRIYQPKKTTSTKQKAVIYIHGGAGVYGSIDLFERIMRHIAKEGDSLVVSVGYGLGPENPYPNQYAECLKATVHFLKHTEDYHVDASHVILAGESIGANFATRVCQLLVDRKDLPKVHAQVLICPALQGMDLDLPSYQQNARVPLLWRDMIAYLCCLFFNEKTSLVSEIVEGCHVPPEMRLKYRKWVNGDLIPEKFKVRGYKPRDPASYKFKPEVYEEMKQLLEVTASPLFAEDAIISKLPQACILTCEFDVLRDDGLLYKKRLEDNGVPVKWTHLETGVHGVLTLFGYGILCLPASKQMGHNFAKFVKNL
ncbi:arylacetamide deacetylase-like 3 isoform X2 [Elgaria multicarinata webbii]|uniref:arylacetamide deacetylase-like 3 isoform X2 n=1 Tax=Elgaria multicarinata webbii TaxID=159646 RepID=UPI002FCCFC19